MDFSAVMNLVLGGGLVATIIAIITLKSTVREARAKAEKATVPKPRRYGLTIPNMPPVS
ncbi:hypothetical protein NXW38_15690 [Bacteroides ovatus]|nr:hypothetical protein [Bacteroides ovatus]